MQPNFKRKPELPLDSRLEDVRNSGDYQHKRIRCDRFIPNVTSKHNFEMKSDLVEAPKIGESSADAKEKLYKNLIREALLKSNAERSKTHSPGRPQRQFKILSFHPKVQNKENADLNISLGEDIAVKSLRKNYLFNKKEIKILEAPALIDSFYFNILSFSSDDILAVALSNHIYSFDYKTNLTREIISMESNRIVSSLSFSKENKSILAAGSVLGSLSLIDATDSVILRQYKDASEERISSIDWKDTLLANGSKNGRIYLRDTRAKENCLAKFASHTQEICSLKFNPFNSFYMISGGNDDKVFLYDIRMMKELAKFTGHKAAVKGLAWSNSKSNYFVSGGGSGDKQICLWDINRLGIVNKSTRQSQICNLGFTSDGLILSTQGYPFNSIELLDPTTMECIVTFNGHTHRVLYLAMNREQNVAVTGSPDETLRFWNVKNLIDDTETKNSLAHGVNSFSISLR